MSSPPLAVAQREDGGRPLEEAWEDEEAGAMQPLGAGPLRNEPLRSAPTKTTTLPVAGGPPWTFGPRRQRLALAGLLVVGLLGTGVLVRARVHAPSVVTRTVQPPPALETSSTSPLGCPIFEVTGLPEFETWVGAAASTLACGRAKWYLGGRDDRILPPAALLGAPVQPTADPPDLYGMAGQRQRTLDLVKQRGLPSLDGHVTRDRNSWSVDLFVRASDGRDIACVEGSAAMDLGHAIKDVVDRLWQYTTLEAKGIDPEVARWTGLPDLQAGLIRQDFEQGIDWPEECATIELRATALGSSFYRLQRGLRWSLP